MDEEIKIWTRVIIGILLFALICIGGYSIDQYHIRKMAALGYCDLPVEGSNFTRWQKCK